jgi:hypothetical protein
VSTFAVTVLGNIEKCRTEAEISRDGELAAVVYEKSDGWHTEIVASQLTQPESDFDAAVNAAQETLSHYVNRLGTNQPPNMTRGAFALWLMIKDDGTAMGKPFGSGVTP